MRRFTRIEMTDEIDYLVRERESDCIARKREFFAGDFRDPHINVTDPSSLTIVFFLQRHRNRARCWAPAFSVIDVLLTDFYSLHIILLFIVHFGVSIMTASKIVASAKAYKIVKKM